LRQFVDICKADSNVLHEPSLAFYREYLESLGATIPPHKDPPKTEQKPTPTSQHKSPEPMEAEEPEEEEPPLDLDESGVIEPENDDPLPMGDANKEATEEDMEKANEERDNAQMAFADGDMAKAIEHYTNAIVKNPGSALLHAKRANALLKINKPVAAIRDCDKAISINPDSAQAYKFRGRANRLLGRWLNAQRDLAMACKLDYDDVANEWLKEVQPNAKKLQERERHRQRRAEEKELKERRERVRRAQEANQRAREAAPQAHAFDDDDEMPGGAGGLPAGFQEMFSDPEMMALFQDQEVMTAYMDIMKNPANMAKHMGNPKVMKLMQKMQGMAGQFKQGPGGGAGPGGDDKSSGPGHQPPPQPDLD